MTNQFTIRPGCTMELETPAVVQRPGTSPYLREVRLRCAATAPDTVELNLRGPGPGRWQLDRGQLARALIAAPTHLASQGAERASIQPVVAVSGTKVVISRRSRIGVTRVWLPLHSVDFFLDCCDQRIDQRVDQRVDQRAPAATTQETR